MKRSLVTLVLLMAACSGLGGCAVLGEMAMAVSEEMNNCNTYPAPATCGGGINPGRDVVLPGVR
jgi:hypothetical protein